MDAVDLYTIGVQLVLDDQVVNQVDAVTKQFTALQTAIDEVNKSLGGTRDIIGEISGASGRIADNWNTAAERMETAAGKVRDAAAMVPGGGGGGDPYSPGGRPDYPGQPGSAANQQHDSSSHDFWTSLFLFGTGYEAVRYAVGGAAEVSATQARLAINQASPAQIAKLTATANTVQAGQPLSIQDVLGIGQDYYSVTGQIPDQQTLAGLVAQAVTMQAEGVDNPVDEIYSGIKSAEIAGKLNTKNADGTMNTGPMMDYLNLATKVSVLTQGRVDFDTALRIMSNAGPEGSKLSTDALAETLLLSAQLGGSKTGVGVQAEGSEFLGGKVNQGVATILEGLKGPDGKPLLDKAMVQKMGLAGSWMQYGALEGQDEAVANPYQWTVDYLIPALAGTKDPNAVLAAIMRTQTRATGQRLMGDDINSAVQLARQNQRLLTAGSPEQDAAVIEQQSLQANLQMAGAGFGAMVTAFTAAADPEMIAGLKAFDDTMVAIKNFATSHPDAAASADVVVGGGLAFLGYKAVKGGIQFAKGLLGGGAKAGGEVADAVDAGLSDLLGEIAGAQAAAAGLGGAEAAGGAVVAGGPPAWVAALATAIVAAMAKAGAFAPGAGNNQRFGHIDPVPVVITNPGAVTGQVVSDLARHQGGMPTGPNGQTGALVPFLPGTDAPGAVQP